MLVTLATNVEVRDVAERPCPVTVELGAPTLLRTDIGALTKRVSPTVWADPDVVLFAARVSVWARWFLWLISVFLLAYRPADWYPADIEYVFLHVPLVTLNGLVHYRLLTNRPVTWRWLLVLSAMDIVLITADIVIGDGFRSFAFLATSLLWPCLPRSSHPSGSAWPGRR